MSANMQHPTLQRIRVRSSRDVFLILNAVASNHLRKVERRLDENERSLIQAGNIYVWEERGAQVDSTGLSMERWTDGLSWGPSRARDEFLYYQQLGEDDAKPAKRRKNARNAVMTTVPRIGSASSSRQMGPQELLVKQTFSANVSLPHEAQRGIVRKWHLTAYFVQDRVTELLTVDDFPDLANTVVPEGVFTSARASARSTAPRRDSTATTTARPPAIAPAPAAVPPAFAQGAMSHPFPMSMVAPGFAMPFQMGGMSMAALLATPVRPPSPPDVLMDDAASTSARSPTASMASPTSTTTSFVSRTPSTRPARTGLAALFSRSSRRDRDYASLPSLPEEREYVPLLSLPERREPAPPSTRTGERDYPSFSLYPDEAGPSRDYPLRSAHFDDDGPSSREYPSRSAHAAEAGASPVLAHTRLPELAPSGRPASPALASPSSASGADRLAERAGPGLRLAPLEYLEGLRRRRHATDDHALRLFSRVPRKWGRSGS